MLSSPLTAFVVIGRMQSVDVLSRLIGKPGRKPRIAGVRLKLYDL
jgi:hypothetical protein